MSTAPGPTVASNKLGVPFAYRRTVAPRAEHQRLACSPPLARRGSCTASPPFRRGEMLPIDLVSCLVFPYSGPRGQLPNTGLATGARRTGADARADKERGLGIAMSARNPPAHGGTSAPAKRTGISGMLAGSLALRTGYLSDSGRSDRGTPWVLRRTRTGLTAGHPVAIRLDRVTPFGAERQCAQAAARENLDCRGMAGGRGGNLPDASAPAYRPQSPVRARQCACGRGDSSPIQQGTQQSSPRYKGKGFSNLSWALSFSPGQVAVQAVLIRHK
jgi:hypothetical protein